MTTVSNAEVLSWKFPNTEGISTKAGVITKWPVSLGPIPDQATVDAWEAEFEAAATSTFKEKALKEAQDKAVGDLVEEIIANTPGLKGRLSSKAQALLADIEAKRAQL